MDTKALKETVTAIGFAPQENAAEIYEKSCNGCTLLVDFAAETIDYGSEITAESTTTQNFSQPENLVVLECVNRLLEKGYRPCDIILEKTYPSGHGHSGRLDILVQKEGKAFLMIECKQYGHEFTKELNNLQKNGGQLFTYFQNDTNADFLMLYASKAASGKVISSQAIVTIEEHYRDAGNVEDVYDRWNKLYTDNGIFEEWVHPYHFTSRHLTKKSLVPLDEEASTALFHNFLSILRKHSVSDKPGAFNVIFDLFLAKLWDEKKEEDEEVDFCWREGVDDAVSFQYRLLDLYRAGMNDFLRREVVALTDNDLNLAAAEDVRKLRKKVLMLERAFTIKIVLDEESFEENNRVLKEVVQLLQGCRIRYPRKQQHLSDFFERLLTTGLKQEAGQFFTPPPITRFIIRSLPIEEELREHINRKTPSLPAVIDYAAGSGHFLTEIMEEYQSIISGFKAKDFKTDGAKKVRAWQADEYGWAARYIYGIEKDYRLVKVAKVGCYFYGDGLAQVVYGDGLESFDESKSYRGLLKENAKKPQFSFLLSNPPYSVAAFKSTLKAGAASRDFSLFPYLTDRSSEIECLFVERMAQLLQAGGIAGVILPSSILSNGGIYAEARKIILDCFEVTAVVELGSNTFMATGTNTVILFLKRRDDAELAALDASLDLFFSRFEDITIRGIEYPVSKYLACVWEGLSLAEYITLLKGEPSETVEAHELYKEYKSKIKGKTAEIQNRILAIEREKLRCFILAYGQRVVMVKTGAKAAEKRFLGYEFSNRRGNEGMHPVVRGKTVDECTMLYDMGDRKNPETASSYIYQALSEGKTDIDVPESMKDNISYADLTDMIAFDRADFARVISTAVKKKVNYERIWQTSKLVSLSDVAIIQKGTSITKRNIKEGDIPVVAGGKEPAYFHDTPNRKANVITVSASGANSGYVNYFDTPIFASDCNTVISKNEKNLSTKLIFIFLQNMQNIVYGLQRGQAQPHVYAKDIAKIKIPLPPMEIQEKIVAKIAKLEAAEEAALARVEQAKGKIKTKLESISQGNYPLRKIDTILSLEYGTALPERKRIQGEFPVYGSNGIIGYHNSFTNNAPSIIVGRKGSAGEVTWADTPCTPIDTTFYVQLLDSSICNYRYIYHILKEMNLPALRKGSGSGGINRNEIYAKYIPLPPISKQKKIVTEIENIEQEIAALEAELAAIPNKKREVLEKYL